MSESASQASGGAVFVRLLNYARPYLALFALSIVFTMMFAGGRYFRLYLIKPLTDEVLVPGQAARESGSLPELPYFGGEEETGSESSPAPEPETTASASEEAPLSAVEREAVGQSILDNLWRIVLAAFVVALILPISHFGRTYLVEYSLGRILVDIQQSLCSKLLELPLRYHQTTRRGDVLSRTLNDVRQAHMSLSIVMGDLIEALVTILVGVVTLFFICWQLTLISLTIAPISGLVMMVFGGKIRHGAMKRQMKMGDVTQRLTQILDGIKVIKAFRAEPYEEKRFEAENLKLFRRALRVVRSRVTARSLTELANGLLILAILVGGPLAIWQGWWGLTLGGFSAFFAVMITSYRPIRALTKGWARLMETIPSAERFFAILDEDARFEDAPDAVELGPLQQGIKLNQVSFSYGREPVLRDINLEVPAGETLAIVGRTGVGKTTLVDLLLRLDDPDSGSIEFDGVDLRKVKRDSLLRQTAVVTQEPFLFAGTVRDNIRYGRPEADNSEVEAAARAAHVDEFVERLTDGYDTEVGDLGLQLSVGQRQRITIARALLRNPKILIFDEATSSLDAKSERFVQDAVDKLLAGRTAFVIAHRLSTIRHADRIVVLEAGTVSRIGSHDELMAEDGLYRELVSLQSSAAD